MGVKVKPLVSEDGELSPDKEITILGVYMDKDTFRTKYTIVPRNKKWYVYGLAGDNDDGSQTYECDYYELVDFLQQDWKSKVEGYYKDDDTPFDLEFVNINGRTNAITPDGYVQYQIFIPEGSETNRYMVVYLQTLNVICMDKFNDYGKVINYVCDHWKNKVKKFIE